MFGQNLTLKLFGLFQVPMIAFASPKVIEQSEERTIIKIPLNWRTIRRDIGSMYLGALVVGADLSSALLAFNLGRSSSQKFSIIFKSIEGDFKKRPESDVFFQCEEGKKIRALMDKAAETGRRESCPVRVTATAPKTSGSEIVAEFSLTLTVKVMRPTAEKA